MTELDATPRQATIQEILDSERDMVLAAPTTYGAYYDHAFQCSVYFTHFVKSIPESRFVCANFLSQTKKHLMLSLFSTVRLHKVQAKLTLRHALESGANAAFAIANPDHTHFVIETGGILEAPKSLTQKRYNWLDDNYSAGSKAIKDIKDQINQTIAHSSLITTHHPIIPSPGQSDFRTPFFDDDDTYHVETDLWLIGRTAIVLMDIIWGVNQDGKVIGFTDDFLTVFQRLQSENQRLFAEKTSGDRYKAAMEKENLRKQAATKK